MAAIRRHLTRRWRVLPWRRAGLALALLLAAAPALAEQPVETAQVQLNFPPNAELRLLVDYVSQRLGVKILYDEQVAGKRITIQAPQKISANTLLQVLESALKMKGLALVEADVPGWKRIVSSQDLIQVAPPELLTDGDAPPDQARETEAMTQAFSLEHVTPERIAEVIKPFLTQPGANTLSLPEQRVLVVTDYVGNLRKIAKLIKTVDQAGPEAVLKFYEAKHVAVTALQKQIGEVLAARVGGGPTRTSTKIQITVDERTNQLIFVGTEEQTSEAISLAQAIDVPLGQRTEVYTFQYVEAARIDRLVQDLFDELTISRLYQSALDEEDNLLIVTATPAIHERIEWLRQRMDVEAKRPGSAVQFYRLKYADAVEVMQTIQSIRQAGPVFDGATSRGTSPLGRGRWSGNGYSQPTGYQGRFVPGPNQPVPPGNTQPVTPPAVVPTPNGGPPSALAESGLADADGAAGLLSGSARVTADPTSNTIIVVADRATQEVYKNLIEFLDRRRPQVMIEAKVIIVDTSDGQSVGVEVSMGDRSGVKRLLDFTSFGLSTVDPTSGALALIPGRGFNWTLVEPDVADAVVRALASHSRSKVISAPRLLVDDNATGTLASVSEVPFTSINASDTVATTSFAGFAEAGTSIEVTPRISEENHLQLDYVVTLNSFTGTGGDGVPPPRQTNEIASSVTIPDGYTVIAGGLNLSNVGWERDGVPFIERIPVLRELSGIETKSHSSTTLFIFLRPVILRDDKFADLKYLADRDLGRAQIHGNYPTSCPLIVK